MALSLSACGLSGEGKTVRDNCVNFNPSGFDKSGCTCVAGRLQKDLSGSDMKYYAKLLDRMKSSDVESGVGLALGEMFDPENQERMTRINNAANRAVRKCDR